MPASWHMDKLDQVWALVIINYWNPTIAIFASLGKSYTMVGPEDEFMMRGVIPRSITQIFNEIGNREAIASTIVRYVTSTTVNS